jgi:glutathione S-transferase
VPEEEFAADGPEPYVPKAFAAEGFIHCTDGAEELARTANRYYRADPRTFVALVIDVRRVAPPVRYEDEAHIYPHIYGALNRDAIVAVVPVPRAADGSFLPPEPVGRD